jgi:predicted dehydrogenase
MAKRKKVRAVLVGCGGISRAWLTPAQKIRDLEIVGLVDLHQPAAEGRKEEFGLEKAVVGTDQKQVIKETEPDAVFDCTVPEAHCQVVTTALKAGCHVLGEKPMADSMANARKMVKAAEEAGRIYAVIQNRRYCPPPRRLRSFLESGAIGEITTVDCDFYIGAHFGGFREVMEHVLLLDMAIHTFDMGRFVSAADPVSVYCKEWNPKGSWYQHGASAVCVFEMTGGIIYTYRGSWCAEGVNTTWESSWRIIGTKGGVTWDGADGFRAEQVTGTDGFFTPKKEVKVPQRAPKEKQNGHEGLLREFVRCVQSGDTPETICTDNIKSLAMVFGAVESAKKGKEIAIKL